MILNMFKAEQFEWGNVPGVEPPLGVRGEGGAELKAKLLRGH